MRTVTVFNLSGIYEHESFYLRDKGSCFCDLKDISGTNCMCDDAALAGIKEKIEGLNVAYGLHFIDSGNYHYMSYILLSMIKESFSLVVFDHHPDMQPPMFGDILSCGGWVQKVIEDNPYVRDVHIIGADRGLIEQLSEEDRKRVNFFDISDIKENGLPRTEYPVYLSVDKDVVGRNELITNWNQGDMRMDDLLGYIKEIISDPARRTLGVDICGECATDQEGIDVDLAIRGNDIFNEKVISFL